MKKLFLLDAFALIYRAHFAFIKRPLINSKGLNVSAITGFTNTLWDVLKKEKPSHIAVVFDLPTPTFRHDMYVEYKANREKQPEDITLAIPYIKEIIEAFNIPVAFCEGYEADDVIGTLAKQAEKEGFDVYMMTPDKDYAQLVSDKVFLYKPARMGNGVSIMGVEEVLEKWQIKRVDQVIDVLGLQGDAVDNIPGIKGIGAKTAVKLLDQFDSIEGILANTEQLKGKQKEKVEAGREDALLSKKLATIALDCPIQFDADTYKVEPFNRDALKKVFSELEFRTLIKRILGASAVDNSGVQTDLFGNVITTKESSAKISTKTESIADKSIDNVAHEYHLVQTAEQRSNLIKKLEKEAAFCFDTETTGLNVSEAELVGIAFSIRPHEAYYVPIPVNQEEAKAVLQEFKELFENPTIAKIGQNIKYDILMLKWYGIEVKGKYWDTMLMHYVLEPQNRHNLNYLAETYLNYSPVSIETLIGKKGKNQLTMRDVAPEKIKEYAGEDADITLQIKIELDKLLEGDLLNLYNEIEEPLIDVLVEIEYNGVNLDVPFLEEYSKVLEQDISAIKKKIFDAAGLNTFNLDSPKQVGEVLFNKMEIPYRWKKTKTGQFSTNEEKLSELAQNHEVVADLLTYRSMAKLKSTYVDALPKLVSKKTGRIHSSFNQALTATGRLSSQNPNLQNIPIRSERGREVRKAFIPKDTGHILLAADYSQIELRLVAQISGDEAMIQAFQDGLDIHKATAAKIYGVRLDEVTKEQRYNAKTVNFSIIYGAGATNLSKNLGIKRAEAKALIDQYFNEYQGLKKYMETVVEEARANGYVTTLKGRRRYLRDLKSQNSMVRSHAERNAINTPIQGSAADMIKLAMIKIYKAIQDKGLKTKITSQVHDELIFDVPTNELEQVKDLINENMKNALENLQVPILVGMDTGANWLEAH
ncbi:DNA polymerase I [Aureispira anguillae]|uniref:DNA polymerase I n=1 Tax=Aureispira anguillae TaxID=2864201 RepID=A0A915YJB7_9BACT|nr:DNA polymerase I [Aureispira anguillae]BDS13893.1 DNA polymerase I [Aureispira anguillae]